MEAVAKAEVTSPRRPAPRSYPTVVKLWLVTGLVMIFVQVVVGGITRLTGSGLSITEWEIVTGTLPPLNEAAWEMEFDKYKATPQYEKINEGMSMGEFKFIYFWEYIHRLWARLMGFVFAIPLAIFWARGMVDKPLLKRLGVVFLLAALVASFGWIMVASGLIDRPWVNAYKLTMHLSLALILFSYLFWTTLKAIQPRPRRIGDKVLKKGAVAVTGIGALQIVLGGIMSGMKAGLYYPTWPDMNGEAVPQVLLSASNWTVENFVDYDATLFMPAFIQLFHRTTAYVLTAVVLWFAYQGLKRAKTPHLRVGIYLLVSVLIIQVALGILTVINCVGTVPVALGVYHQAGALLLLSAILYVDYQLLGKRY
ncbi:MAG: heme A synthase [Bacteroidetes bacterium]|jgi:cytochrome c oxidase assembly protein subunit 15|nr:heme A synthase [Bacteroidota bacterium]